MLTGSIPPTGIPLPFISAGGTSLMVFMGAIGVLCNVGNNEVLSMKSVNVFGKINRNRLKKV